MPSRTSPANHPALLKPQHCPYTLNLIAYDKDNQATTPSDTSPVLNATSKSMYNKLAVVYYTTPTQMTQPFSWQCQPLPCNKMPWLKKTLCASTNSLTTYGHTQIQKSDTERLTWYWMYTWIPSTSVPPRHKVMQEVVFFLCSIPRDSEPIIINGAIHITCTILKLVAVSAAEAELGKLFLNAQEDKVSQLVLKELGHLQPSTPIHIDNTTTVGIVNNTTKRQRPQAMEMWYFWLLDS